MKDWLKIETVVKTLIGFCGSCEFVAAYWSPGWVNTGHAMVVFLRSSILYEG